MRNGSKFSILEHEHRLGLKWKAGLGRIRPTETLPPCIDRLQETIAKLGEELKGMNPVQINASPDAISTIQTAFEEIGPLMWPDSDRGAWLVDAASETWSELYERNLYYSSTADKAELLSKFRDFAVAKCEVDKRKKSSRNRQKQALGPAAEDVAGGEEDVGVGEGGAVESEDTAAVSFFGETMFAAFDRVWKKIT